VLESFPIDITHLPVWTVRLVFSLTVIWLVAALTVWLLRRSSASVRHRVWGLSVVAALMAPATAFILPELKLGWLESPRSGDARADRATAERMDEATTVTPERSPALAAHSSQTRVTDPPAPAAQNGARVAGAVTGTVATEASECLNSSVVLPANWLASQWWFFPAVPTVLGFWRVMLSLIAGRRIAARSTEITDPACRRVLHEVGGKLAAGDHVGTTLAGTDGPRMLRESAETAIPLCVGWWRPCIILPADWRGWSDVTLRAVITHELSHVVRRDVAWQLVAHLACALYWFHPLAWLASRRMRVERETACDDSVLRVGEQPAVYARVLVHLTERMNTTPTLKKVYAVPSTVVAMAACSGLEQRVRAILAAHQARFPVGRSVGWILALATALFTLSSGMLSPFSNAGTAAQAEEAAAAEKSLKQEPETTAAASPSRDSEPGFVTGEVVRAEDGMPVAGTLVLLRDRQLHRATTDEMGRFRFEKIPPGRFAIWAHKDDLTSPKADIAGRETEIATLGVFPQVRLAMKPGKQVSFSVTSAVTGAPIEGAAVRFGYPDRRVATTDKQGAAVISALLPEKYEIRVEASDHAQQWREIDLSSTGPMLNQTFSLRPGGIARGIVTDESGKPLEKAEVVYFSGGTPYGYYGSSPPANAPGQFIHRHLPLDTPIRVDVRLKDYLPQSIEITLTERQREKEIEFRLQPRPRGASITGVVTGPAGKPVAGASVANYGTGTADEKREATTDDEGRFVLHDVQDSGMGREVIVRARGFVPARQKLNADAGTDTAKDAGTGQASAELDVRLEKAHFVRGRVQDELGRPIKGAHVDVNGGRHDPHLLGDSARTDDAGRFEFDSLPAANKVHIYMRGYSSLYDAPLAVNTGKEVVITLEPMGVVRGKVVDAATGKPVEKFLVRLDFSKDRQPGDVIGTYGAANGNPGVTIESKDGTFLLKDLTNRMPLEITIDAEGYERVVLPRVVAATMEAAKPTEISLKSSDRSTLAKLAGKIVDHRVSPAAGVHLRLIVTSDPSTGIDDNRFNWALIDSGELGRESYVEQFLTAVSDEQGKFEFKDLLPGRRLQIVYWGDAAPKGRWHTLAKTEPGTGQSTIIRIPEPVRMTLSIDSALFPDAAEVHLDYTDHAILIYREKIAKKQTEVKFENLPPGQCRLSVCAPYERHKDNPALSSARPLAARQLTIEAGKTYDIKLTAEDKVKQP
jgi:BlaR1 peptidase M56/Carboxypeptidase regulatory-like domain